MNFVLTLTPVTSQTTDTLTSSCRQLYSKVDSLKLTRVQIQYKTKEVDLIKTRLKQKVD